MQTTLDQLRAALDDVDHRFVALLAERNGLVGQVARLKRDARSPFVRDAAREQSIVDRARRLAQEQGLDPDHVERLFRLVLDHSVKLQREYLATRADDADEPDYGVGYQGGEGAFSHIAARRHFKSRGQPTFTGYPSFRAMLEALRDGEIRFAILPLENSIAGSIHEAYDLLLQHDVHLVGEELQPVEHCLVGLEVLPLHRIRRVLSHPVALAQCQRFLGRLENCHVESYVDTALAVLKVKDDQDPSQAAIASDEAARIHGLPVLERGIADSKENFTRMVVVSREPRVVPKDVPAKTSVVLSLSHRPGALAEITSALAKRGLNLTKIESRPAVDRPFEYVFYVDFEGNVDELGVSSALDEVRAASSFLRVLGCYRAAVR